MKFKNPIVIHYVKDMDRARTFYTDAFGVPVAFASPGWTTLDFGVFELALHILDPGQHEAQAQIEARGGTMIDLREAEPHIPVRVASFVDPEGNGFELRQSV